MYKNTSGGTSQRKAASQVIIFSTMSIRMRPKVAEITNDLL